MKTAILEEIMEKKGNCLLASRCKVCPFRNACLPEFATETGQLTHQQRYNLAFDVITEVAVMDDIPDDDDLKRRVKNIK